MCFHFGIYKIELTSLYLLTGRVTDLKFQSQRATERADISLLSSLCWCFFALEPVYHGAEPCAHTSLLLRLTDKYDIITGVYFTQHMNNQTAFTRLLTSRSLAADLVWQGPPDLPSAGCVSSWGWCPHGMGWRSSCIAQVGSGSWSIGERNVDKSD